MISSPICMLFAALSLITFGNTAASARSFSAAPKHPSLKRSDGDCAPSFHGHELVFAEESYELFVATVKIEPTHPMLILEDLDDHIRTVMCSDDTLLIEFHDTSKAVEAATSWGLHDFFVLVTHEHGCQLGNEHTAWNVSQPTFRGGTTISFSATLVDLKQATRLMSVELGEHLAYKADLHRLAARQATTTAAAAVSPSFSFASPTATAKGLSLSQDISFSEKKKILIPPEGALASLVESPANFSLSCVDCTLDGAITLSAGAFDVVPGEMGVDDFFTDGFIDFEATNIGAHMEFSLEFLPGFQAGLGVAARLPSLNLGGINIAGLLQFGPVLDLVFPLGVTLNTPVTFITGFTVKAPPSLSIHLNISDPLSSDATGFSDASLDALPFTADTDQLAFDFFIGFRPEFRLDAYLDWNDAASIEGGIGVYLDLPRMTANIAPLTTANENCTASSGESLYLLSPSIAFGGSGVVYDIDTSLLLIHTDYLDDTPYPINNATAIPLDAQCLSWDAKAKTLASRDGQQENGSWRASSNRWTVAIVALSALFMVMTVM